MANNDDDDDADDEVMRLRPTSNIQKTTEKIRLNYTCRVCKALWPKG